MRALPVRDEASFASTRAFLLEAWLCCNATTGDRVAHRSPRPCTARVRRRRMIAPPFARGNWRFVYLAFAAGEAHSSAMHFDLTDLRLFRQSSRRARITHGAERAHLALAAASTRIRNMEESLGAPLLTARPPGRDADRGRAHAAPARAHDPGRDRAAARGPRRLFGRARRPGQGAVEHQRADSNSCPRR